jgi:hypothetical protein
MRRIALFFVVLAVAVQMPASAAKLAKQSQSEQNAAIYAQLIKPALQKSLVEDLLGELEDRSLAYAPPGWEEQCAEIRPAVRGFVQSRVLPWTQKLVDGDELADGVAASLQEQLTAAERLLIVTAMDSGNVAMATYLVANHRGLAERLSVLLGDQMKAGLSENLSVVVEGATHDVRPVVDSCKARLAAPGAAS